MLPALITQSKTRVASMVTRQQSQPTAQPFVPADHSLAALVAAMPACKGCELYCNATQVVPGKRSCDGDADAGGRAAWGQGRPCRRAVCGAGRAVLDGILAELGIPRPEVFVTNAVKHFKFVQRGQVAACTRTPRMSEISACRPWLLAEIEAVKPKVILCLGASASKSLLGGTFALMKDHGKLIHSPYAEKVLATIHPSAVLRARDEPNPAAAEAFSDDRPCGGLADAAGVSMVTCRPVVNRRGEDPLRDDKAKPEGNVCGGRRYVATIHVRSSYDGKRRNWTRSSMITEHGTHFDAATFRHADSLFRRLAGRCAGPHALEARRYACAGNPAVP